jgi:hypothetical protein
MTGEVLTAAARQLTSNHASYLLRWNGQAWTRVT